MALFIQHGHGKSDKIEQAFEAGYASGVVYAPRNEIPANLSAYIQRLRTEFPDALQMVDPQFYAATVIGGQFGKLVDYPYFHPELQYRHFVAPDALTRYAREVIDYQRSLDVSHICSPTISVDSFRDKWNSVALNLAAASIDYHASTGDARPLVVSILAHEQALRSHAEVDELLDILTDLECAAFYVVVRHEKSTYNQNINPSSLASLLYMVHVLRVINEYDVYVGYIDLLSPILHATGVSATACGWNYGLRRFSFGRFEPSTGGRRPKARYGSLPLLNAIAITPELDLVARAGFLKEVLTGTDYDSPFQGVVPSSVVWSEETSALHHWNMLHNGITRIVAAEGIPDRLERATRMVESASSLYTRISRSGVPFEAASGPSHLNEWANGIEQFRTTSGV